jgi:hypothetical protein
VLAVLLQANLAVISADVVVGEASTGGRGFLDHVPQAKELEKINAFILIKNYYKKKTKRAGVWSCIATQRFFSGVIRRRVSFKIVN